MNSHIEKILLKCGAQSRFDLLQQLTLIDLAERLEKTPGTSRS